MVTPVTAAKTARHLQRLADRRREAGRMRARDLRMPGGVGTFFHADPPIAYQSYVEA